MNNILITGAAGNLGSHLARHLINQNRAAPIPQHLKLLIHRRDLPQDIAQEPNVTVHKADLAKPETLSEPCQGTDCIIHFAGVLFEPRPEKFLAVTNTHYVKNLVNVALKAGVKKFIIVSFPHVEGVSTPDHPAKGILEGNPSSLHAQTRLAAEKYLFEACGYDPASAAGTAGINERRRLLRDVPMTPIALRAGMIYGRGVLMIDVAKWLSRRRLLFVWKKPTWIHLVSLPDFLSAAQAAIEREDAAGIYSLGDERPLTLQEFLDTASKRWGIRPGCGLNPPMWVLRWFRSKQRQKERPWREGHPPWRAPAWAFYAAAALTEAFAAVAHTRAPLTRDFIRIGMASYVMDISRMKAELQPELMYPTLAEGIGLL